MSGIPPVEPSIADDEPSPPPPPPPIRSPFIIAPPETPLKLSEPAKSTIVKTPPPIDEEEEVGENSLPSEWAVCI